MVPLIFCFCEKTGFSEGNGAQLPCSQSAGEAVKMLEAGGNGFTLFAGDEIHDLV